MRTSLKLLCLNRKYVPIIGFQSETIEDFSLLSTFLVQLLTSECLL